MEDREEISRLYRWNRPAILASVTLGYGLLYTCRLPFSVIKKPLIDEGVMNAEQLGRIGMAFAIGYAVSKFFSGFLADHSNVRKLFTVGVLLSAGVNLMMLGFQSVWAWMGLWFANGWFQAVGSPCAAVAVSNWYSVHERGRCYSIFSSSHSLGEGMTYLILAYLVSHWGWQAGFVGPGVIGFLVAAGIYLTLRDRPETMALPPVADFKNDHGEAKAKKAMSDIWQEQLAILKMPEMWILGIASAGMYVSRYAINNWGILYLQDGCGYSLAEASWIMTLNTAAGVVGAIAYGFVSDFLFNAKRPPVTLIFGILETLAMCVMFFGPPNIYILLGSFIVFGFSLSGLLAALPGLFAIDIAGRKAAGAALGFMGIISYLGVGAQDWISGYLIKCGTTTPARVVLDIPCDSLRYLLPNDPTMLELKHYNFNNVIYFWIGASVFSMILATTLWRVKAKD